MRNRQPSLPRVLIVDDEREILTLCETALAPHANVTSLTRGADAFQAASALRPDVILLDLAMPGVDGWQVCRELRADVRTARIPVILLTGYDEDDVTPTAIRLGVRAVLIKPFSVERLVASLLAAVEISWRQREEQILERYYELYNEHRGAEAEGLVAVEGGGSTGERAGRQVDALGELSTLGQWIEAFPDTELKVLRIDRHEEGYRVDLLAEGTHRGDVEIKPFGRFQASGRTFTLRLHHHVQIRDGKLTRSAVGFDPQDLGRQLVERAS